MQKLSQLKCEKAGVSASMLMPKLPFIHNKVSKHVVRLSPTAGQMYGTVLHQVQPTSSQTECLIVSLNTFHPTTCISDSRRKQRRLLLSDLRLSKDPSGTARGEERVNHQGFQHDWGMALVIRCVIVIMAVMVSHMTRNDQRTRACRPQAPV